LTRYNVVVLPSAVKDLDEIFKYLSMFYEATVRRMHEKIDEKISILEEFPFLYEEYQSTISDVPYRRIVIDDYLVFYTVSEATVEIHRILNAKRDVGNLI
jgi:addiction module RelE/StbE family toxin